MPTPVGCFLEQRRPLDGLKGPAARRTPRVGTTARPPRRQSLLARGFRSSRHPGATARQHVGRGDPQRRGTLSIVAVQVHQTSRDTGSPADSRTPYWDFLPCQTSRKSALVCLLFAMALCSSENARARMVLEPGQHLAGAWTLVRHWKPVRCVSSTKKLACLPRLWNWAHTATTFFTKPKDTSSPFSSSPEDCLEHREISNLTNVKAGPGSSGRACLPRCSSLSKHCCLSGGDRVGLEARFVFFARSSHGSPAATPIRDNNHASSRKVVVGPGCGHVVC